VLKVEVEVEVELTVGAAEPRRRKTRLDTLLFERRRRRIEREYLSD
jgi:hypothetical protein